MPTVIESAPRGWPVAYREWDEWRRSRVPVDDPPAPASTEFCAICWGQGRVLRPAANGEGHVPVACARCDGTGWVAHPSAGDVPD